MPRDLTTAPSHWCVLFACFESIAFVNDILLTLHQGTQPLPASDRRGGGGGGSSFGGTDRYAGTCNEAYGFLSNGLLTICSSGYARQERDDGPQQLPTKPPYTAHLGNLSYDATQEAVSDFFAGCEVTNVRIVEDREERRPKGFGYAEFATVEGLKKALELNGENFQSRVIRIRIADPRTYYICNPYKFISMLTNIQLRTEVEWAEWAVAIQTET